MFIESLEAFLNTEIRKKVFLYYLFSEISPSEIVKETKMPFSTVDRITNTLKMSNFLLKSEKSGFSNYYNVNWEPWLEENLKLIELGFIGEVDRKDFLLFFKNTKFLAISYLLAKVSVAKRLFKEPLKLGDRLLILDIISLLERKTTLPELPALMMLNIVISPVFKELRDVFDSDPENLIKIIKEETSNQPFLLKAIGEMEKDAMNEYIKTVSSLAGKLERLFDQRLQNMSSEVAKTKSDEGFTSKYDVLYGKG